MERWLSFLLIATSLGGQCLCLLPRLSVMRLKTSRQSISTINSKPFKHTCYLFAENDNNEIDLLTNLESQENITETIEGSDIENSTITIEGSGLAHYFSRRKFIGLGSATALLSALYYYQPGTYVPKPVDPVTSVGNEIIYEEALLPYSSVRQFKSITLSNGMEVLLVQDKMAVQSTAALTVRGAGQFSDPADLGGLAHLMEHMTLAARRRFSLTSSRKASLDFEEWLINYE